MRSPIQAALDGHLHAFQSSDVAWENIRFEPNRDDPWLRPFLMPASSRVVTAFEPLMVRHIGIYQINVNAPGAEQNPPGAGPANLIVDALIAHFRPGTVLHSGGLNIEIEYAEDGPAHPGEDWFVVPISVGYSTNSYPP